MTEARAEMTEAEIEAVVIGILGMGNITVNGAAHRIARALRARLVAGESVPLALMPALEKLLTSAALADHAGDYMDDVLKVAKIVKASGVATPHIDEIYQLEDGNPGGISGLIAGIEYK